MAARQAANRHLLQVIGILHQEGAPLLLGTDTPNPYVVEGFSLHQELANFVAAGLTPFEAIRCGTAEAARFVQQEREWGTIAPGRRADLLLVRANPLADVAALRSPEAVFVNGFQFTRADLDGLLEGRERAVQAPPAFTVGVQDLDSAGEGADAIPAGAAAAGSWRRACSVRLVAGAETGRLAYRHEALAGGGWLIRELYQGAVPMAFTRRSCLVAGAGPGCASRWVSSPDERRGRGVRGGGRRRRGDGRDADGRRWLADARPARRRAGARGSPGAHAAGPRAGGPRGTPGGPGVDDRAGRSAAGHDGPGLRGHAGGGQGRGWPRCAGERCGSPAVPAGERIVELRLDRPGQRIEQTFRVGSDGHVLAIAQLVGIGRREFTPVSERRAGSVHG